MKVTIVNTGGALAGAAFTTIGGFIILYLAPTDPMRVFGATTAMSISFSLIGSIFILPSFLGVYAKRKMAKDPKYFEKHVDINAVRDHVSEHIHDFNKSLRHLGAKMIEAEHKFAHKISEYGDEFDKATGKAKEHIVKTADKLGDRIDTTAEKTGKKVIGASDKLGEKIDEVAEKVAKGVKKK
jgi:multidrug efflux pump subunit AcrB